MLGAVESRRRSSKPKPDFAKSVRDRAALSFLPAHPGPGHTEFFSPPDLAADGLPCAPSSPVDGNAVVSLPPPPSRVFSRQPSTFRWLEARPQLTIEPDRWTTARISRSPPGSLGAHFGLGPCPGGFSIK